MWKSLLLGLLVSIHTRIFLVFMRNYEAKSPLFMIKRAGLNYVPRQSYSKNSHGSYILKWILVINHRKMKTTLLSYSEIFPCGGRSRLKFSCPNKNSCIIRFPCSRCSIENRLKEQVLLQVNDILTLLVVFIAGEEKNLLASLLYPIKEQ